MRKRKEIARTGTWELIAALALCMAANANLAAEPTPEKIRAFLDACERFRPLDIANIEKQISDFSSRSKPRQRGKAAGQKSDPAIMNLKKLLVDIKARRKLTIPTLQTPFVVGEIGYAPGAGLGQLFQVVDEQRMLVKLDAAGVTWTVLVRGESTANRADTTPIALRSVYEVVGTYKYTTALGSSNTVMVIEPFDLHAAELAFENQKPTKKKK